MDKKKNKNPLRSKDDVKIDKNDKGSGGFLETLNKVIEKKDDRHKK